jgi:hypothetical protein
VPALSPEVVKAARPLLSRVAVPRIVDPSWNVILPVGMPSVLATLAVKVIAWLKLDGLADALKSIRGIARLTLCAKGADVLAVKLLSPV